MSKSNEVIIRSVQELNIRYARFCAKNELDETLDVNEQYAETDAQKQWLDRHFELLSQAKKAGALLARGRTDVVRSIVKDLNSRFNVVIGINVKNSISRLSKNTKQLIEVVAELTEVPEKNIESCPSPLILKNSKVMQGGEIQLVLPFDF